MVTSQSKINRKALTLAIEDATHPQYTDDFRFVQLPWLALKADPPILRLIKEKTGGVVPVFDCEFQIGGVVEVTYHTLLHLDSSPIKLPEFTRKVSSTYRDMDQLARDLVSATMVLQFKAGDL